MSVTNENGFVHVREKDLDNEQQQTNNCHFCAVDFLDLVIDIVGFWYQRYDSALDPPTQCEAAHPYTCAHNCVLPRCELTTETTVENDGDDHLNFSSVCVKFDPQE